MMFVNCLQAENDPIAPSRGIPRQDIKVGHLFFKVLAYESAEGSLNSAPMFSLVLTLLLLSSGKSQLFIDCYPSRWAFRLGSWC